MSAGDQVRCAAKQDRDLQYLTGADTTCDGIVGAMLAGAITASIVMGSPLRILKAYRESKTISLREAHALK